METQTAVKKKGLSADYVFEELKHKIEAHFWYPGDRLPAENDLAEEYGVSRITVRTALQRLSALGLVETRTGGGTYVSKFDFFRLIESVSGIMFSNISHDDVSVYRTTIEAASMDLIAQKPVLTWHVKDLQTCIGRMRKASETFNRDMFAKADYEFHLCLCKMTGNSMFVYAYELLYSTMLHYFFEHYELGHSKNDSETSRKYYDTAVYNHQKILDCIQAGEFERAKSIVTHMTNHAEPFSYTDL